VGDYARIKFDIVTTHYYTYLLSEIIKLKAVSYYEESFFLVSLLSSTFAMTADHEEDLFSERLGITLQVHTLNTQTSHEKILPIIPTRLSDDKDTDFSSTSTSSSKPSQEIPSISSLSKGENKRSKSGIEKKLDSIKRKRTGKSSTENSKSPPTDVSSSLSFPISSSTSSFPAASCSELLEQPSTQEDIKEEFEQTRLHRRMERIKTPEGVLPPVEDISGDDKASSPMLHSSLAASSTSSSSITPMYATTPQEDFEFLKRNAKHGDAEAQYKLARKYMKGEVSSKKSLEEAVQWFSRSAEQGYAKAEYALGWMYQMGFPYDQRNYLKAYTWLLKAARKQYVPALYSLGVLYHSKCNKSFEKDVTDEYCYTTAFRFYKAAAQKGYAKAEKMLERLKEKFPKVEEK
jgi:TPR repeat protein